MNKQTYLSGYNNPGFLKKDSKEKLDKAYLISTAYNIGGFIPLVLMFFTNSKTLVLLGLLYPLLGIVIIGTGEGLIKVVAKIKEPCNVIWGLVFSLAMLVLKSCTDFQILQYTNVWFPFIIVSAAFFFLLYLVHKKETIIILSHKILLFLLLSGLYGFAGIIEVNCIFDKSPEKIYQARVLDHEIYKGRRKYNYYLTLAPWGPQTRSRRLSISEYEYENYSLKPVITIHLKSGRFNIPWFIIST